MSKFCSDNISTNLQAVVDSITSSCAGCCFILPNISNVVGISNYFTSTDSLPDIYLCNIPDGQTAYIDGDVNAQVIASRGCWIGFDQRLLRSDAPAGEIWTWGLNSVGQLGDNSTVNRSSPVSVVGGFTDWCQVAAGCESSSAIRLNGSLWMWGSGTGGQLGDNTTISKLSPVSVVGGYTDWCQISGGQAFTLAVRANGSLWAWGCGSCGRLGSGTITNRSSPVSVVGGFTDWCQISAGTQFAGGIRSDGSLWMWGAGTSGQLGDNTIVNKSSPVSVVGEFTDWCQVSVGQQSAAIRTNGTLWAWGNNTNGSLGDGTTVSKSSPVSVLGGFTDWCRVSVSHLSTVAAVRTNGTLWAWGCNSFGELGDETTIRRSSPVSVVGGFTNWCQVSAGCCTTAAIRTDGTLWNWGVSERLGSETTIDRSSPVIVVGGFTDWSQVSIEKHGLALRKY